MHVFSIFFSMRRSDITVMTVDLFKKYIAYSFYPPHMHYYVRIYLHQNDPYVDFAACSLIMKKHKLL